MRAPRRDPTRAAAGELLRLVLTGEADARRLAELVDVLLAAEVPFKESLIGGGPWVVVCPAPPVCRSPRVRWQC